MRGRGRRRGRGCGGIRGASAVRLPLGAGIDLEVLALHGEVGSVFEGRYRQIDR